MRNATCPALQLHGQPVAFWYAVVLNALRNDWLRFRTRIISNPNARDNPCRQLSTYVYYTRTNPMTESTAKPAYLVLVLISLLCMCTPWTDCV
jgi:hypothetical protein